MKACDLQFCKLLERRLRWFASYCSWRLAHEEALEFQSGRFRRYRTSKGCPPCPLGWM